MSKTIITNHDLSFWTSDLALAQDKCGIQLPITINFFLEDLLSRFINQPTFNDHSFSKMAFLVEYKHIPIQDLALTADSCLFYIGLFPNRVAQCDLDPKHFIQVGKKLYSSFDEHPMHKTTVVRGNFIAEHYIDIVDTLLSFRETIWDNEPIEKAYAYQLWKATGSKYAIRCLNQA